MWGFRTFKVFRTRSISQKCLRNFRGEMSSPLTPTRGATASHHTPVNVPLKIAHAQPERAREVVGKRNGGTFPHFSQRYNSRVLTSTCEAALQPTVAPSYSKGRTRQIPPTATRINYPGFVRGPLHPPAREWKIAESISARHRLLCARGVTQIPWPLSQDHAPPA